MGGSQSLKGLFIRTGVLVTGLLASACAAGYLLFAPTNTAALSLVDWCYVALIGLAAGGVAVAIFMLYRATREAVQHDIESLARMFHDVREGELREAYPIALRDFTEIFLHLREAGRKMVKEKAKLKGLGLLDHLSQLSNRRHFERRLKDLHEASRAKGPSSVLLIDIDHFKSVNDEHGHDAGDALIIEFSKALRACVRQSDFLARLGGDEFCIIYPYASIERAERYVERLRQQLPRELSLAGGITHTLRWTGGLSVIADSDTKFDAVLWRADKALLCAKEAGRNNTKVFDPAKGIEQLHLMLAS